MDRRVMPNKILDRDFAISQIKNTAGLWDIIIIGGGATGLGTALDAASRGYKVLLLEKYDFAKGTSSRSTKLAHGGVRYLKQGDISMVMEALEERGLMMRNAPHLVRDQKFIIPTYEWWDGPFYNVGLKLYDLLAWKLGLGSSRSLSLEETIELIPTLETKDLKGGVVYHDGQFDDARLAINLAQTAVEKGAVIANYMDVISLIKENGMVEGVVVTDKDAGETYSVYGRVVINATGVFADSVIQMDDAQSENKITPSQGIHIVLNKEMLPGDTAIMVPKTDDDRVLFAVPWNGKVIVGTTDTPVDKVDSEPEPREEEIEFLLNHISKYLVKKPTRKDVKSIFTGLRPLVKDPSKEGTSKLSRSHALFVSESGLITITGGKWTTYRKMAQDTVDKAAILAGLEERTCMTRSMRIHGWKTNTNFKEDFYYYGSDIYPIRKLMTLHPSLSEKLDKALPLVKAQVVWAVRHEMAITVEDFLARRTRSLFLDAEASLRMTKIVAELMADELGKDKKWIKKQMDEFEAIAKNYLA